MLFVDLFGTAFHGQKPCHQVFEWYPISHPPHPFFHHLNNFHMRPLQCDSGEWGDVETYCPTCFLIGVGSGNVGNGVLRVFHHILRGDTFDCSNLCPQCHPIKRAFWGNCPKLFTFFPRISFLSVIWFFKKWNCVRLREIPLVVAQRFGGKKKNWNRHTASYFVMAIVFEEKLSVS